MVPAKGVERPPVNDSKECDFCGRENQAQAEIDYALALE
jgi:hypothetical protein